MLAAGSSGNGGAEVHDGRASHQGSRTGGGRAQHGRGAGASGGAEEDERLHCYRLSAKEAQLFVVG